MNWKTALVAQRNLSGFNLLYFLLNRGVEKVPWVFWRKGFLDVEYTQVPTYMVCQDVPSFLAHFHSGENNFSNFKVRHLEYVGDYLEITHVTLGNAVGYLSQRTNSLFQFDPACRYYSRAYTKPFRILKEGSPGRDNSRFRRKTFSEDRKIEGEYWDAIILGTNDRRFQTLAALFIQHSGGSPDVSNPFSLTNENIAIMNIQLHPAIAFILFFSFITEFLPGLR